LRLVDARVKLADDPRRDYRKLVASGYDTVAATFNASRSREDARALDPLCERIPSGARVLDLGCGAGVPIARRLSRSYDVVGVDLSAAQLELARRQAPGATFVRGDMTSITFRDASFDAVVSFYAIFHVPREQHAALFVRIRGWLRPRGYLLATLALHDEPAYTEDFFGAEMFWSNYGIGTYRAMLGDAGFAIVRDEMLGHGYGDGEHPAEAHPFVLAQAAGS
jgi:SAM-dependent methyltransferase